MARTLKDKPYKWWKEHHPDSWRLSREARIFRHAISGAWPSRTWYANRRNRQERHWWKTALRNYETEPARKFPRRVAWDVW